METFVTELKNDCLAVRSERCSRSPSARRAAAVVEFAVMLPVVIIFVFGAIELANGYFLKQAVSVAAYEGARAASRSSGTQVATENRINEVLISRGINNRTITVNPDPSTASRGDQITVTVSVPPTELQSFSPLKFLNNKTFIKSVSMVRH